MKNNETDLDKYDFPVSRIGNAINPKLIILLENQASNPDVITLNPEYVLYLKNEFKPNINSSQKNNEHMGFDVVIKYDKWWYELSKIWLECESKLGLDDVLSLEYYPYATSADSDHDKRGIEKQNEIYKYKWDGENKLAKDLLLKNLELLNAALINKVPIFVYYKSGWYSESMNVVMYPKLVINDNPYISHYDKKNAVPSGIKNRLKSFLASEVVKNRIEELRNDPVYTLKK